MPCGSNSTPIGMRVIARSHHEYFVMYHVLTLGVLVKMRVDVLNESAERAAEFLRLGRASGAIADRLCTHGCGTSATQWRSARACLPQRCHSKRRSRGGRLDRAARDGRPCSIAEVPGDQAARQVVYDCSVNRREPHRVVVPERRRSLVNEPKSPVETLGRGGIAAWKGQACRDYARSSR